MSKTPQGPAGRDSEHESTDTLPLLSLRAEEIEAAGLPPEPEAVRVRPRAAVPEPPQAPAFTATDTFQVQSLAPVVARPVAVADLAETLRAQERHLHEAIERVADLEAELAQANRRCRQLEQRGAALEAQVAAARTAAPAQPGRSPAPAAGPVVASNASAGSHDSSRDASGLEALQRQNRQLHEALSTVQARIGVYEAMIGEAEAARDSAHPPAPTAAPAASTVAAPAPAPAPTAGDPLARIDWQARFNELEAVLESERAHAAARARAQDENLARLNSALEAARAGATQDGHDGMPPRQLPIGSSLRVLVREEAGTEFVYPLGRHTTIGRTPDNDIQVNTTFVSRHHAVLLTSSEHCIIEDLNSTNGIAVNGHRVGRQLLQDGDIVTVGKTHFRYETR